MPLFPRLSPNCLKYSSPSPVASLQRNSPSPRNLTLRLRCNSSPFSYPTIKTMATPSIPTTSSLTVETRAKFANGDGEKGERKEKLHGRAFYNSIGSPRMVLAPMVDQSEFAWRMLTRSFMASSSSKDLLAYTPMFHARLFSEQSKIREQCFQPLHNTWISSDSSSTTDPTPYLDGNAAIDRPLFVQFCANDADHLLAAAKHVAPYCDAVDLNLGCPQGIAKKGNYGAFLQESPELIFKLVNTLYKELDVPVTAKFRILETKEKTLEYAKLLLDAGASILTLHGRRREQKGHNTGLADWSYIRYLRDNLPPDTVIFANGNILVREDIQRCLEATGADGVMSAEGNLHDPSIFGPEPPVGSEGREFWRDKNGKGGYRIDAVIRRYFDIIYKYILEQEPPKRTPLWISGDAIPEYPAEAEQTEEEKMEKRKKKKKKNNNNNNYTKGMRSTNPNLTAMQAHLFALMRHLVSVHTHIRNALASSRGGDMQAFEHVLSLVERETQIAIQNYGASPAVTEPSTDVEETSFHNAKEDNRTDVDENTNGNGNESEDETKSSKRIRARCARPWWICQPYIRPLPDEAMKKGSMQLSKKRMREMESVEEIERVTKEVKVAG